VNVGTAPGFPSHPGTQPGSWRVGSSSADAPGVGRRARSSPSRGKPEHMAKLRRLTRRWITLAESRGSEGGLLAARLTWTRKREGTKAWRESVESCEGVDGAAAQGQCDMAKTRLFEAKFPGMEMCILRHTTPGAEPPVSGESPLLRPNLPTGGRWATSSLKGTDRPPTSHSIRPTQEEFGIA
jgi:hypothetical protein